MKRIDWTIKFLMIVAGMWLTALAFATQASAGHGVLDRTSDGYYVVAFPTLGPDCTVADTHLVVIRAVEGLVHGDIGSRDMNAIVKTVYPELLEQDIMTVTLTIMHSCGLGGS